MKKILSVLLVVTLFLFLTGTALAGMQYDDGMYSFLYPGTWTLTTKSNGESVIVSENGQNAFICFCIRQNAVQYTGDEEKDGDAIRAYIDSYGGQNYKGDGTYESLSVNGFNGFRAFGSWSGAMPAEMIVLTDDNHLVGILAAGQEAIDNEDILLQTLATEETETESAAAGNVYKGYGLTLTYPEDYVNADMGTGVTFVGSKSNNDVFAVKAYELSEPYSAAVAEKKAAEVLPKSAGIEAKVTMVQVGDHEAALIEGVSAKGGSLKQYVIGNGYKAWVLLFMGDSAVPAAEDVVRSVVFDVEEKEELAAVDAPPAEMVGTWKGTGKPKNNGPTIELTVTVNADGTGEYLFVQSGYRESYPFTVSSADGTFTANIPKNNMLGITECGGTYTLDGDKLILDILTKFGSGGNYSYTAECTKE